MTCPICRDPWPEDEPCQWCEFIMYKANEIVRIYTEASPPLEGSVPAEIRNLIREIDFTFERDPMGRRYFNVAYELLAKSLEFESGPIPIDKLKELRGRSTTYIQDIFSLLGNARIARLLGNDVVLEEMAQRIGQLLPITNPREPKDEMKGLLCVVLANEKFRAWREHGVVDWRPLRYLLYEKGFAVHIRNNLDKADLPRAVTFRNFFDHLKMMNEKSRLRAFKEDVLFGGKIFDSFPKSPSGKQLGLFKETVLESLIWWRERERERERERGR